MAVLVGCMGLWGYASPGVARTMYTTDSCEVVVRAGRQIAGRNIVKVLPSGTPVDVREVEEVWTAVRLADGRTGFVESNQLIEREPYKLTAERLQAEIGQHRERTATLTQQLTSLRQTEAQAKDSALSMQQSYTDMQQQLAALREAHATLQQSSGMLWFLTGGGVMLMGWILGLLSARWRGNRRQSGYSYNLPG